MVAILVHHLRFLDFSKTSKKLSKIGSKAIKTNKNTVKWSKTFAQLPDNLKKKVQKLGSICFNIMSPPRHPASVLIGLRSDL